MKTYTAVLILLTMTTSATFGTPIQVRPATFEATPTWFSEGKIYLLSCLSPFGKTTTPIYLPPDGEAVVDLSSSLVSLSEVIFIQKTSLDQLSLEESILPFVAMITTSYDGALITDDILKAYASCGDNPESVTKELAQCTQTVVSIKDNSWTAAFYVLYASGSIEKWQLTGELAPFSINRTNKTIERFNIKLHPFR